MSWRGVLVLLFLVVAVSAAAGGAMTYWLLAHFTARVPLDNQVLSIKMPPDLPVSVQITDVSTDPAAAAPAGAEQRIPVRIKQRFSIMASIDSRVPLKTVVPYRGEIPVHTTLHMDTKVRTRVLGIPVTLPVVADVPLDLKLPVDIRIPVDQSVRMKFTVPVTADIDQVIHVPIPGVIGSRITFLDGPLKLHIQEGELELPLNHVSLEGRVPWGGEMQIGPAQVPLQEAPLPRK